ncbi:beta strand repeat-containing protein [Haloferula sp.]|uniref:beta strand repeat-containing protein n=1 Tax=Haloferula sp. TaxID=2497595 RepID=UPI003C750234
MSIPKNLFVIPAAACWAFPLSSHAADVVRTVASGSWATTSEWEDLGDSSNHLPTTADTAIINQSQVVNVDSFIATEAGPVLINNTDDTALSATLNINEGGDLITGPVTIGAGNDEGFLNILGGTLNAGGMTVTANNLLNAVNVSSGLLATGSSAIAVAGGELNVNGGSVTTSTAFALTGGEFNLSSGSVTITDPSPDGTPFPVISAGPAGVLNVSGGDFNVGTYTAAGQVYTLSGEINISGGTFGVSGTQGQMRSDDGPNDDAPLEMTITGDDATVNIPRFNTNNRPAAILNFVFDETGVSPVKAPGFIHLVNTTVNIDGSAYTGDLPATFELVVTTNIASTAPTVNITGLGAEGVGYTFSQSTSANNFTLTLLDPTVVNLEWEGATDDNWSEAANWIGGVAPTGSGDEVLNFPSGSNLSVNNDLAAGLPFRGFAFANTFDGENFTLGGSSIQLSEGITAPAVDDPNSDFIEDTINLDIQLVENVDVSIGAGRNLNISGTGIISEDASPRGLNKGGSGTLTLGGANTFTGPVAINEGIVNVTNASGLGSISGNTSVAVNAAVQLSGDISVGESLALAGTGNVGGGGQLGSLRSDGDNTLTGDIAGTNCRIQTVDGTGTLILTGTFTGMSTQPNNFAGNIQFDGPINVTGAVNFVGSGVNFADPGFDFGNVIDLNVATNIDSALLFFDGYVRLGVNNALATNADLKFGWTAQNASTVAFDLNGFDQTLGRLRTGDNSIGVNGDANVTGGGTLTVNLDSGTDEYQGRITDGSTPTVLVKDGAGTLIINNLSGTPSNYTGSTTVSGGTLSLAQAELANGSTVSIATGAVLNLTHSDIDVVAALKFGDDFQPVGFVYNEANSGGFITGTGSIQVGSSAYDTWASGFPGLTDNNSSLDFENDGLETGIEYVVGGDPTANDAGTDDLAPTSTYTGSGLEFVFRRTDLANDDPATTIIVQYGSDLVGWFTAVDGEDGVTIEVPGEFEPGVDQVVVTLPSSLVGDGKMFARLSVTID